MRAQLWCLSFLVIAVLAVACDDSPAEPGDEPLALETVAQSPFSGFFSATQQAIRNEDDWVQVWETLHAGQSPQPSRPDIDFDRDMVLLAATGPGSNSCYAVEITRATRKADGSLEVAVTAVEPTQSCNCLAVITYPAHLVKVERVDGPLSFVQLRRPRPC